MYMKATLLLLLFFPAMLFSQARWAVFGPLPAGVTRIELPTTKHASGFDGRECLVRNEAEYKALFPDSVQSQLPVIDFAHQELLGKTYCGQFLAVCGAHPHCHRNACRYTRTWYLVDTQHRTILPADTLTTTCNSLPYDYEELVCTNDSTFAQLGEYCSVLRKRAVNFDSSTVLVRSIFTDCNAQITHELYTDTLQQCVVWRLFIVDGGCRGMDESEYVLVTPKPPPGYAVLFEEFWMPGKE